MFCQLLLIAEEMLCGGDLPWARRSRGIGAGAHIIIVIDDRGRRRRGRGTINLIARLGLRELKRELLFDTARQLRHSFISLKKCDFAFHIP